MNTIDKSKNEKYNTKQVNAFQTMYSLRCMYEKSNIYKN